MLYLSVRLVLKLKGFQAFGDSSLSAISLAGRQKEEKGGRADVGPEKGQDQVVDHLEIIKGGGQLESSQHPHADPLFWRHMGDVCALVQDGPCIGQVITSEQVEKGGLSRPVGPDDPGHLIFMEDIVDAVYGDLVTESLREVFSTNDFSPCVRIHGKPLFFPRYRVQNSESIERCSSEPKLSSLPQPNSVPD
jgi:hypothetical protein